LQCEKDICYLKNSVTHRIRKLREQKDYSQQNMADELGLSLSAYNKIERGVTDTSVNRLAAIAKILEVDVIYFFQDQPTSTKVEERHNPIGYASKSDIEELTSIINKMQKEFANLKASLQTTTSVKKKNA
jgi:transcriptional regulator with XRE-family HTH domain